MSRLFRRRKAGERMTQHEVAAEAEEAYDVLKAEVETGILQDDKGELALAPVKDEEE